MQKNRVGKASKPSSEGGVRHVLSACSRAPCITGNRTASATSGLPGGWTITGSRPGSAKNWVERCQKQREQQEILKQNWQAASDQFRKDQFCADFFNAKPSAPRCVTAQPSECHSEVGSEPEEQPHECDHTKETSRFEEDRLQEEDKQPLADDGSTSGSLFLQRSYPTILGRTEMLKPEIAALKSRLEELQKRNEEERQKLNEELSHRAWQSSSTAFKELESERLAQFVRSAWPEQRRWLEQERIRKQLEEDRIQQEADQLAKEQHERDAQKALERQRKREQYQKDLQEQLDMMKRRQTEERVLEEAEQSLAAERDRLMYLANRSQEIKSRRDKEALSASWSRQHQIRLRQRAAAVLRELSEDEALLRDIVQRPPPHLLGSALSHQDEKNKDFEEEERQQASLALGVLREHARLEELRQQEYELLFSEEAERLWRCREQQWRQEREARQALLQDVLQGRHQQLLERQVEREAAKERLHVEQDLANRRIAEVEEELTAINTSDNVRARLRDHENRSDSSGNTDSDGCTRVGRTDRHVSYGHGATGLEGRGDDEDSRRQNIARLEAEMARLWGPLYVPPHYGRKKVLW